MNYADIAKGFEEPYGPYIAQEILDHVAVRRIQKDKVCLDSVSFCQGRSQVGIDDFDNEEFGDGTSVLFRGILIIADKRWLTEAGRDYIQSDINLRFGASFLKLDYCIRNYKIKLLIQDSFVAPPRYLISTLDLRIFVFSENTNATYEYEVNTLNIFAYSRSRKFLSKYRALNMIETIVAMDKSLPRSKRTPLEGRSPKWLVDRYLGLYYKRFEGNRVDPSLTPRHVHRSEIYSVFGRHAKWLGETVRKKKLLNPDSWNRFRLEVTSRWDRQQSGEEEDQLHDWNDLENLWNDSEVARAPADELAMDIDETSAIAVSDELEYASVDNSDSMKSRSISPEPGLVLTHRSVKENVEYNSIASIADPDVLATVPTPFYSEQPVLQSNLKWFCPDQKCSYSIDFLDIPTEVLDCMDCASGTYLKSRTWKANDEEFMELFYDIAERHYFCHLDKTGIKVVGFCSGEVDIFDRPIKQERRITEPRQLHDNDHPKFKWIKPQNHLPAFSQLCN